MTATYVVSRTQKGAHKGMSRDGCWSILVLEGKTVNTCRYQKGTRMNTAHKRWCDIKAKRTCLHVIVYIPFGIDNAAQYLSREQYAPLRMAPGNTCAQTGLRMRIYGSNHELVYMPRKEFLVEGQSTTEDYVDLLNFSPTPHSPHQDTLTHSYIWRLPRCCAASNSST